MLGMTMADQIRELAKRGGATLPCDPASVDLALRQYWAQAVGGKLWDVNAALRATRRFRTVEKRIEEVRGQIDALEGTKSPVRPALKKALAAFEAHQRLIESRLARVAQWQKEREVLAKAKAKRAAEAETKREQIEKRQAARAAKRRSGGARSQLSLVYLSPDQEWIYFGIDAWAEKHRTSGTECKRRALQAEVVDREMVRVELPAPTGRANPLVTPVPLPAQWAHLRAAVDETAKRLGTARTSVMRTAYARFLKREGFGPKWLQAMKQKDGWDA